jgi:hypothetical protein
MDGIISKASQRKPRPREEDFDLIRGRNPANAVENVGGLYLGQHCGLRIPYSP